MAKPAAEMHHGIDYFDAVLKLGDVAPQAPESLGHLIYLGIRLSPDGDALDEIAWCVGQPAAPAKATVCARHDPLLETIRLQLANWFADPAFTFTLPLTAPRTAFQQRLRAALCATRHGDTMTYGDLARQLHSAPRAVGQALGSNPLPMIVPCHRIVSAGRNRLTGFDHASDGPKLALKAWLLAREANA